MTIVIADKTNKGKVVFGADSRLTADTYISKTTKPKIKKVRGYLIGYAGECSIGELFLESYEPPRVATLSTLRKSLIEFLKLHLSINDNNVIDSVGSGIEGLISTGGRLWHLNITNNEDKPNTPSIYLVESIFPYIIGDGSLYGLGAYSVLRGKIKYKIKETIKTVAKLCNSVDDNIDILEN